jgi:hypothetical protein
MDAISTEDARRWYQNEYNIGYKAFHDCQSYESMTTDAEREGWVQARRDTLRQGQEIAKRGQL